MKNAQKRELIERLCNAAQKEEAAIQQGETFLADLILEAATALEATLWRPIADMPDELKDGRFVPLAVVSTGELFMGRWMHSSCGAGSIWVTARANDGTSFTLANPTHYQQITTPEDE